MHNSLEVLLDSLIHTRIDSLYGELSKTIPAITSSYPNGIFTSSKLHKLLPEDIQKTLFLHDDADLSVQAILDSETYLQGFKDALHLHNELNVSFD